MDVKVYEKETVSQPSGTENVYVPNVIDIIPEIKTDTLGNEILSNATILESDNDVIEQMCGLSTIWQIVRQLTNIWTNPCVRLKKLLQMR